jgi:hypothetical protein
MGTIEFVKVYMAPELISPEWAYGLPISEGLQSRAGKDYGSYNCGIEKHEVGVPLVEKVRADDIVAAWVEAQNTAS